jgi:hypothetical protein
VLAGHYGFTAEELDFIVKYDIKFLLPAATPGGDEQKGSHEATKEERKETMADEK